MKGMYRKVTPKEVFNRLEKALRANKIHTESSIKNIKCSEMDKKTALNLMSVCYKLYNQVGCQNTEVVKVCELWCGKNASKFTVPEATQFLESTIPYPDKSIGRLFCLEYTYYFLRKQHVYNDVNKLMSLLDVTIQKTNNIGMPIRGLRMYRRLAKTVMKDIEYLKGVQLTKLLITYVDMSKLHREVALGSEMELNFMNRVINRAQQLLGGSIDEFGFQDVVDPAGGFNQRSAIALISKIPATYWQITPKLISTVISVYGNNCTASKAVSICQTMAKQKMLYNLNRSHYEQVLSRFILLSTTVKAPVFERAVITFHICQIPSNHAVYDCLIGILRGNRTICTRLNPFWPKLEDRFGLAIAHSIMCIAPDLYRLPLGSAFCCLKIWSESLSPSEFKATIRKWKSQILKLDCVSLRRSIGMVGEAHQEVLFNEIREHLQPSRTVPVKAAAKRREGPNPHPSKNKMDRTSDQKERIVSQPLESSASNSQSKAICSQTVGNVPTCDRRSHTSIGSRPSKRPKREEVPKVISQVTTSGSSICENAKQSGLNSGKVPTGSREISKEEEEEDSYISDQHTRERLRSLRQHEFLPPEPNMNVTQREQLPAHEEPDGADEVSPSLVPRDSTFDRFQYQYISPYRDINRRGASPVLKMLVGIERCLEKEKSLNDASKS